HPLREPSEPRVSLERHRVDLSSALDPPTDGLRALAAERDLTRALARDVGRRRGRRGLHLAKVARRPDRGAVAGAPTPGEKESHEERPHSGAARYQFAHGSTTSLAERRTGGGASSTCTAGAESEAGGRGRRGGRAIGCGAGSSATFSASPVSGLICTWV